MSVSRHILLAGVMAGAAAPVAAEPRVDCAAWVQRVQGPVNPGPASPPGAYEGADFASDVKDLFETLKELTGLSQTRLEYHERHPYCPVSTAANEEGADTIYVCPALSEIARNRKQLTFVMAHEFGHVEKRHWAQRQEAGHKGIAAWNAGRPVGYFETTPEEHASREISDYVCSGLAHLSRAQEEAADQRAVDLLVQHEGRLKVPPSAGVDAVWNKKEFLFRQQRHDPVHPDASARVRRILLDEKLARMEKLLKLQP